MKKDKVVEEIKRCNFLVFNEKFYRKSKIKNFQEAGDFMTSLDKVCKKINHGPEKIIVKRKSITVVLSGATKKDARLAKEIDSLLGWKRDVENWITSDKVLIILSFLFIVLFTWLYFTR